MKVRFSEALPLKKAFRGRMPPGSSITVVPKRPDPANAGTVESAKAGETEKDASSFTSETVTDLAKRSAELLSTFDRELKYEMRDDAGVVQIQVIDARDGQVIRKIPADEVVKLIEAMKKQIDDRVDVWA